VSIGDEDPYAVCRYIRHYHRKNGYAPTRDPLFISENYLATLVWERRRRGLPALRGGPADQDRAHREGHADG
jgi:hypothetical protein